MGLEVAHVTSIHIIWWDPLVIRPFLTGTETGKDNLTECPGSRGELRCGWDLSVSANYGIEMWGLNEQRNNRSLHILPGGPVMNLVSPSPKTGEAGYKFHLLCRHVGDFLSCGDISHSWFCPVPLVLLWQHRQKRRLRRLYFCTAEAHGWHSVHQQTAKTITTKAVRVSKYPAVWWWMSEPESGGMREGGSPCIIIFRSIFNIFLLALGRISIRRMFLRQGKSEVDFAETPLYLVSLHPPEKLLLVTLSCSPCGYPSFSS